MGRPFECSPHALPGGAFRASSYACQRSPRGSLGEGPPQRRWLACWLALCLVLLQHGVGFAQSEPKEPFAPDALLTPLPDVLNEGTLRPKARLWFSDRNGNLVLAPEEFAEDYFSSRGKGSGNNNSDLLPSALQRVELQVNVVDDVAQVAGTLQANVSNDYATTIPLALGSVQWTQWTFSGPVSQNRLQPQSDESGWRWIVQSQPDEPVTASLQGVTRVARELDRRQLLLSLPTAPCVVRVQLPTNAVDVRVRNEDVLQRKTVDGVEYLEISSSGGEFMLSWRDRAHGSQAAAIHATSETEFIVIDPTQPWLATTTLTLRWYGRDATNQLRLALPPGGRWRSLPSSDFERYRISSDREEGVDESTTSPANLETLPLLLENFDIVHNETVKIELEWEWAPGTQTNESLETEIQLDVPMVIGVDQHTGTVDCIATSAYAIVFKEGTGARLTVQGPLLDAFGRQQLQFEFDHQPFDLTLLFRREQSLPTIRPTYLVHVDRNKLTLTMWLDCSFDTNQPQMELGLILDDWVVQENTARIVNASDTLFSTSGEILRVQQQVDRNYVIRSTKGDVTSFGTSRHVDQLWRVVAERIWNAEEKELYFQVPQIIRGHVNGNPEIDHGSGAVLVTSENNVLLNWLETSGTGLQRDSFSTEYRRFVPNPGVRKPLVYRFQSSETTPRWAGRAELLERQVSLEQHVDLEVATGQVAIRQEFDLQVANEALEQLRFAVRKGADGQTPQVLINGLLFSASPVATIDEQTLLQMQYRVPPTRGALPDTTPGPKSIEPATKVGPSASAPRPPSPRKHSEVAASDETASKQIDGSVPTSDESGNGSKPPVAETSAPSSTAASNTAGPPEYKTASPPSASWQIYQVPGVPELIGATKITIQTGIPWKDDGRSARGAEAQANMTVPTKTDAATGNTSLEGKDPSSIDQLATDVVVPLAQLLLPSGTTHIRQDWTLHTDLQVETLLKADEAVSVDAWVAGHRERPLTEYQHEIALKLQPRHLQGAGPVRIDKCWLQSFVGGGKRRERFVVHVKSNANQLRLKLPREAIIREGKVKVSVNGADERLFGYDQQTDIVTIPLASDTGTGQVVENIVEVSYFLPDELSWITGLTVSPPEILGVDQIDQFYWQLLTPAVQHLGWSPSPLTAEWTWQWSGLWWNRHSRLDQQKLESWIGALGQESPPASANSYVMSGRGMEGSTRFWVLSRFVLWFPVGLLAIAVSFIALNFPVVRKPSVVIALAIAIAGLAMLWPDLAVLAGQTAVVSLGLVALVWLVQAGVDSRVRRRSVFAARTSTYIDRSDHFSVSRGARPPAVPLPHSSPLGSSTGQHGGQ